ncbi:MAG: ABC transporter permease [Cyclobacteriaceae bacterium]
MRPPKWANRFLEWYCNPSLLEEIQGDVFEIYERDYARTSRMRANARFVWNVIRFFRWSNIRKNKLFDHLPFHPAMIKNILTISLRNFIRYPGYSITNILGLAAGFACAMIILLWVMHEFSYDQFHENKSQLYKVVTHVDANGSVQTHPVAGYNLNSSSVAEIDHITRMVTGTRWPNELCFRPNDNPDVCVYFNGVYADPFLFTDFSITILQGDANPLGMPNQIAISNKMASALYPGEDPIGKQIKIDDHFDVVISAVFEDVPTQSTIQFDFAMPFNVVMKLWGIDEDMMNAQFFDTYIKTHQSVEPAVLTERLNSENVIGAEYKKQKVSYEAVPFTKWHLNSKFENGVATGGRIDYVWFFVIIGALIVLLAVINFVNMSTARSALRAKEIGIRKVNGAVRASLILQFMGESFLFVLVAFGVAVSAAHFTIPAFNQLIGEPLSIRLLQVETIFYLAGFLVLVALLAGFYPALVISSLQPAGIIKGQIAGGRTGSMNLRKVLMVVQLSASVVIIIFSGILYHQLDFVTQTNLGFDRKNTLRVEPTYELLKSYDVFKNDLMSNPIIEGVGASNTNPLSTGGGNVGVSWPGKPENLRVSFKTIGTHYDFPETIGLQLLDGRFFGRTSLIDSLHSEVVISEMSAKVMGLEEPVGTRITIGDSQCEVIGVVNDFHTASLHEAMAPVILYRTDILHVSAIYIKYQPGKAREAQAIVNDAYRKIEPKFTMKYWFQDDTFDNLYKTEILAGKLVLIFALIALVIASIGIAGLATFHVMRKTKEIGIRRVFGASVSEALFVLLREFSTVLLIGMVVSVPVAWYVSSRWLEGFAYRTGLPWWIFLATVSGVFVLVVLIVWVQGQKTITTNPTQTLRSE